MNTTRSGGSVKRILGGFLLAVCLAFVAAGTVGAAGGKSPGIKGKSSCSKACSRIKVTQDNGTTVQCGKPAEGGPTGCMCKCGDAVVATTPK